MLLSLVQAQLPLIIFGGLAIAAAVCDIRTFKIPNRIPLSILLLYPTYIFWSPLPIDWTGGLMVGGGVLAAGFVLFSLRVCGGGDAKLLAASAVWAGPELVLPFVFITALGGGGMAVFLWVHHRLSRATTPGMAMVAGSDPNFGKQPMAYGAAVAAGALYVALVLLDAVAVSL